MGHHHLPTIPTPYEDLLDDILRHGSRKDDRTGTGTTSIFGAQLRYDLRDGFPLITTKKVAWRLVVSELLWFLRGDTTTDYLHDNDNHIWDEWAGPHGELGPIYGAQWRYWPNFPGYVLTEKIPDTVSNIPSVSPIKIRTVKTPTPFGGATVEELWQKMLDTSDAVSLPFSQLSTFRREISTVPGFAQWSTQKDNRYVLHTHMWGPDVPVSRDTCLFAPFNQSITATEAPHQPNHITHTVPYIDQISQALDMIKQNPDSRRIVVSAWNPTNLEYMHLPPCHSMFQFYVNDGRLSCQLYQRSADMFLGVPFNIASYSLLTSMMAQQTGLEPGEFIWTGGDCHIYDNHRGQVEDQLTRKPRPYPTLKLDRADSLFDYRVDDCRIVDYNPHPAISAPVAV